MQKHITILFFFLLPLLTLAQERIWIEGRVLSADSLLPLKNVHIISRMTRSGTITDEEGKFKLRGHEMDTVFFSAVGFQRRILSFDLQRMNQDTDWRVLLRKDTIVMEEVVVRSFYDWPTFKHMFVHMPSIKPVNLDFINEELKDILLYVRPSPLTLKGPIQTLYDLFNDMARLQRRLERNRRIYNQQLIREGKMDQLIPEQPDHLIEKP